MFIKTKFEIFEIKKEKEYLVTPENIILALQRRYGTDDCDFKIIE